MRVTCSDDGHRMAGHSIGKRGTTRSDLDRAKFNRRPTIVGFSTRTGRTYGTVSYGSVAVAKISDQAPDQAVDPTYSDNTR